MNIRIGFGYDVHQLKEGFSFHLGGIKIPHYKGTVGHSDGDPLIHSMIDALFGAANMGDIGLHFPDQDKDYKNIDSKILLKKAEKMISKQNYLINNFDCTICLQKPKIKDFIPEMKKILSEILSVSVDDISIKATTTEKMGFIGSEQGISAYSVVLLKKN